jgi:hypothetical protein
LIVVEEIWVKTFARLEPVSDGRAKRDISDFHQPKL